VREIILAVAVLFFTNQASAQFADRPYLLFYYDYGMSLVDASSSPKLVPAIKYSSKDATLREKHTGIGSAPLRSGDLILAISVSCWSKGGGSGEVTFESALHKTPEEVLQIFHKSTTGNQCSYYKEHEFITVEVIDKITGLSGTKYISNDEVAKLAASDLEVTNLSGEAVVNHVVPESFAHKAGFQEGDIIFRIEYEGGLGTTKRKEKVIEIRDLFRRNRKLLSELDLRSRTAKSIHFHFARGGIYHIKGFYNWSISVGP